MHIIDYLSRYVIMLEVPDTGITIYTFTNYILRVSGDNLIIRDIQNNKSYSCGILYRNNDFWLIGNYERCMSLYIDAPEEKIYWLLIDKDEFLKRISDDIYSGNKNVFFLNTFKSTSILSYSAVSRSFSGDDIYKRLKSLKCLSDVKYKRICMDE